MTSGFKVTAIDHVQLAMPKGQEDAAESFYGGLLGFTRVPKPEPLAARGGCWFDRDGVQVHLGVDDDFRPARKAHPALRVHDLAGLVHTLAAAGVEVRPDTDLPELFRVYVDDPFGNRIELIDDPTH